MIDEPHVDIIRMELSEPPIGPGVLCLNMNEGDMTLEQEFPDRCQTATILLPPTEALIKEIDGDQEGFINIYNEYLSSEDIMQFITAMIYFLHIGGKILIYTPADLDTDAILTNTLIIYFYTRFGISIGTSEKNGFDYDARYDGVIADLLYQYDRLNVFEYINLSGPFTPSPEVQNKILYDLTPYCDPYDPDPLELYRIMKNSLLLDGQPITKPAVMFERNWRPKIVNEEG